MPSEQGRAKAWYGKRLRAGNVYEETDQNLGISRNRGSEFSSYEIELRNRVMQNDVTLRVTNSKMFIEILLSSC